MFFVETKQSDFAELRPFCKESEMQSILDSIEKRIEKELKMVLGPKSKSKIFNFFETIH